MTKRLLCLAIVCSMSPLVTAAPAGSSLAIEEILVTATKRGAFSAQDVSIAINAIDGSTLDVLGATQFDQWAGQVPGLSFESWGPGDKDFVIRGINSPTGGTVGVYYDEAVITGRFLENGGGRQVDIKLHDLDHIEVLKGPQGTLYGANSLSGTIKYISKKPNLEKLETYIEVEGSDTDNGDGMNSMVNGMLDVPLIKDTLGLRIVGWQHDNAGYIDNNRYHKKGVNDEDTTGVRATLQWRPLEDLNLTANYTRQTMKLGNDSRITPRGVSVFAVDPAISGIPGPAFPGVSGGKYVSTEVVRTPWDEEVTIYGLTADWRIGPGTLTATTNTFKRDIDYIFDSTPIMLYFGADRAAVSNQLQDGKLVSSEIRYATDFEGKFNFVVGAFYQKEDTELNLHVLTSDSQGRPEVSFSQLDSDDVFIGNDFGTGTVFGRTLASESKSTAYFGEGEYDFNEQWKLTLGVRYFDADHESQSAEMHPFFGFAGSGISFQKQKGSDSKTTWKVNLAYTPTDDSLYYLNVATGFRPGGTNAVIIPGNVVLPESYKSDELISFELGGKTSWLDGSLVLNGSIYYIEWTDMQTGSKIDSFAFTTNIGEVHVIGSELDLVYRASENWTFGLGGAYVDTELQEDEPAASGDFPGRKGDRLPNVPKWTSYAAATYTRDLNADIRLRARLDYSYRGSSGSEVNRTNVFYHGLDSYGVLSLNVALLTEHWTTTFFVNNLTNEHKTVDYLHDEQEQESALYLKPITYGLRLKYNF